MYHVVTNIAHVGVGECVCMCKDAVLILSWCCFQALKRLSLINSSRVIELKGRVACELHTQEVLITELLFQSVLSRLKPAEIAALLSCVVFQQVQKICYNIRNFT